MITSGILTRDVKWTIAYRKHLLYKEWHRLFIIDYSDVINNQLVDIIHGH